MECTHKITLKSGLVVPCGKCPSCLANSRSEWIFRLSEEAKHSEFSVFVTLTYDEDHLPPGGNVCKKDVQDFHKRLRKHFPSGDLRYYLVSEYGDHTFRPHYHGLYFFHHKYEYEYIYNIFLTSWQNGFIKFGEVEAGSIVYCTKYCLKHKILPDKFCTPNFRLISKMSIGGIGVQYLDTMKDYHLETENFISVYAEGKRSRMPRYFRDRINPYKGASKYNPLHYLIEQDYEQERRESLVKRFQRFLSVRKFSDFKSAQQAFAKYENQVAQNREDLLMKHVKKQKF